MGCNATASKLKTLFYKSRQNEVKIKVLKPVMLDSDLAKFYSVETKVFNQLNKLEYNFLRSQSVTLKNKIDKDSRGKHRKYLPFVFTK